MSDGLRQRGGATAFVASTYLRRKREAVELSLRRRFGPRSSLSDEEAQHHLMAAENDVNADVDGYNEFQDEEQAFAERESKFSLCTRAILILAAIALTFNILVMVGVGMLVSSIVGSAVAVAVGVAQLKLEDVESLREVQNMMRKDINRFANENTKLHASVEELKSELSGLKETEQQLEVIARAQDSSLKSLVKLVQENKITLQEMKQVVREDIIADIMGTGLKGERDGSGDFSDVEIKRLLLYMRGLPAVTVNEENLMLAVQKDRSILALFALIHDISTPGIQEGDNIFIINDENRDLQTRFMEAS